MQRDMDGRGHAVMHRGLVHSRNFQASDVYEKSCHPALRIAKLIRFGDRFGDQLLLVYLCNSLLT